jgi:hypothetical protein
MVELGLITDCAGRPEHDLQIAAMRKQTRSGLSFAVGVGENDTKARRAISETRGGADIGFFANSCDGQMASRQA